MVKVYTRGWNSNLTYLGWMRRQKTSELYGRYTISLWLWSYSFHTDFQHKIRDFSYLDLFGSFYEISRLKKSGSSIKKSWLRHSTLTLISLVFGPVLPTSKVRNFFHTGSSPCHICLLRHSQVKAFAAFSFHTTDCSIIYLPASFAQLSK